MYLTNPKWLKDIIDNSAIHSENYINEINARLGKIAGEEKPIVSIIIPVKNEEQRILQCIDSLSRNKFKDSVEIIVVNNNSTDSTPHILSRLSVRSYDQPMAGIGSARQLGLEQALGKYVLTADGDCIYPQEYIITMVEALKSKDVACVTGRYSFIGGNINYRWRYQVYEGVRDVLCSVRQKKYPFLNAWGGCMGYIREIALELGYDYREVRGEDGRLCFDLMSKGKVVYVGTKAAKAWTYYPEDESLFGALLDKFLFGAWNIIGFLQNPKDHDTKTSANSPDKFSEMVMIWKKKNK